MYEFFTENKFNSILPKHTAKEALCICEAVCQIGNIKAQMCSKEESVFLFTPLKSLNPLTAFNYFSEVFWRWKLSAFHALAAFRDKILNYIRSYRNRIRVYTSLPFLYFLRLSSEDWYVYDDNSSKLAA
jgi:hypothetical protein